MNEEQRYRERIALEKDKIILLKKISESLEKIANSYGYGPYHVSCDLSKDDKAHEDAIKAIQEIDGGHLTVVGEEYVDPFELPN